MARAVGVERLRAGSEVESKRQMQPGVWACLPAAPLEGWQMASVGFCALCVCFWRSSPLISLGLEQKEKFFMSSFCDF